MPTYQYICKNCRKITDIIAKMGEAPRQIKCIFCNGNSFRKYNLFGMKFKGKGFYCNDTKKN
jgi:putative FmdB family regulatory protein